MTKTIYGKKRKLNHRDRVSIQSFHILLLVALLTLLSSCSFVVKKSMLEEHLKDGKKETSKAEKRLENNLAKFSGIYDEVMQRTSTPSSQVFVDFNERIKEMRVIQSEYQVKVSKMLAYMDEYIESWGGTKEITSKDPEYTDYKEFKSDIKSMFGDVKAVAKRMEYAIKETAKMMKENKITSLSANEINHERKNFESAKKEYQDNIARILSGLKQQESKVSVYKTEFQEKANQFVAETKKLEIMFDTSQALFNYLGEKMGDKDQIFFGPGSEELSKAEGLVKQGKNAKDSVKKLKELEKQIKKIIKLDQKAASR